MLYQWLLMHWFSWSMKMASVLLGLKLVCSFLFTDGAIKVRYGETVMVQFKATKRQGKEPFFFSMGWFSHEPNKYEIQSEKFP